MSDAVPKPDENPALDVSVVVPFYNEEENAAAACREIAETMTDSGLAWELICIDDGSADHTLRELEHAAGGDPHVTIIELRRNFGQSAALAAGFDRARGAVVVPLDGDLQNDPADISALLAKLKEAPGYDVVSGWRAKRRDNVIRKIPSRVANGLISIVTGVHLHDYGCTLKAYRREVLADVRLYGEMHRFIPALARWVGGRVTEMPVNHRPRRAGTSKYGMGRIFRVLMDLATVKFMMDYIAKPLYFFGKIGFWFLAAAFGVLAVVVGQRIALGAEGGNMTGNPLLYLSVAMLIISVQVLLMGLIMEVLSRTYHESQDRKPYTIRSVQRGGAASGREDPGAEDA